MLQLFLDGQKVALSLDTKIGITAMNPFFNEMEATTYTFTIPYKPNEHILKHAGRIQNATRTFSWSAILIVDAVQILRGEAICDGDLQEGNFPIILRSAKSSFVKQAEAKTLQEVDFGSEDNGEMTQEQLYRLMAGTHISCYPTTNYVVAPFYNKNAYSDAVNKWTINNYISQYNPVKDGFDVSITIPETLDSPSRENYNSFAYSFYIRFILKSIIEDLGYTLIEDEMETIDDLNRWFLLSLNRLTLIETRVDYRSAFSRTTVRDFLVMIRQFGIAVIIDEKLGNASIKLVKSLFGPSTPVSKTLDRCALRDILMLSIPSEGYTIAYKEAADDYVIQDPSNFITIADASELPAPSGIYSDYHYLHYSTAADRFYMTVLLDKVLDTDPDVYAWRDIGPCRPYVLGNGETKVELGVTAVGQRYETRTVTRTIIELGAEITQTWDINIEMPRIDQAMNTAAQAGDPWVWAYSKYEDTPMVLLFNWGRKMYVSPNPSVYATYPVISGDAYDCEENLKGSISMRTTGTKSIVTQLVKDEQDWILRRKQKRQYFNLTLAELSQFKWNEIQNIGSVNYFVNSLKYDLNKNGLSLVEAELFTV